MKRILLAAVAALSICSATHAQIPGYPVLTDAAVMTMAMIMTDPTAPHAARVAAAAQLLDRGHGRPRQTQDLTVTEAQHYVRAPSKVSDDEWKRCSNSDR